MNNVENGVLVKFFDDFLGDGNYSSIPITETVYESLDISNVNEITEFKNVGIIVTGFLKPDYIGVNNYKVSLGGSARMYLDETLIFDKWASDEKYEFSFTYKYENTRWIPFVVYYRKFDYTQTFAHFSIKVEETGEIEETEKKFKIVSVPNISHIKNSSSATYLDKIIVRNDAHFLQNSKFANIQVENVKVEKNLSSGSVSLKHNDDYGISGDIYVNHENGVALSSSNGKFSIVPQEELELSLYSSNLSEIKSVFSFDKKDFSMCLDTVGENSKFVLKTNNLAAMSVEENNGF